MPDIEVIKSSAEQYYLRQPKGWWAVFFLDDDYGFISVQSNYGNYGHVWTKPGRGKETLKEFLITADTPYILDKFSYGMEQRFDHEASVKMLKEKIGEKVRSGLLDFELSADDYVFIVDEELSGVDNERDWSWLITTSKCCGPLYYDICDGDPTEFCIVMDYQPRLRYFMERVWPHFIDVLKKERETDNPGDQAVS